MVTAIFIYPARSLVRILPGFWIYVNAYYIGAEKQQPKDLQRYIETLRNRSVHYHISNPMMNQEGILNRLFAS